MQSKLSALGAFLVFATPGCQGHSTASDPTTTRIDEITQMTLDEVVWSDDTRVPESMREYWRDHEPVVLLGHVAQWSGYESIKSFTARADKWFWLEAEGHQSLQARTGVGGLTSIDGEIRFVLIRVIGVEGLNRSVEYTLRPRNGTPPYAWIVTDKARPPEES